jgi:hypothetical protein
MERRAIGKTLILNFVFPDNELGVGSWELGVGKRITGCNAVSSVILDFYSSRPKVETTAFRQQAACSFCNIACSSYLQIHS